MKKTKTVAYVRPDSMVQENNHYRSRCLVMKAQLEHMGFFVTSDRYAEADLFLGFLWRVDVGGKCGDYHGRILMTVDGRWVFVKRNSTEMRELP